MYSVIKSTKTDPGPEGGGASVYTYLSSALVKCSSLETLKQDSSTIFTIIILEKKIDCIIGRIKIIVDIWKSTSWITEF